jgi:hypothetical protein
MPQPGGRPAPDPGEEERGGQAVPGVDQAHSRAAGLNRCRICGDSAIMADLPVGACAGLPLSVTDDLIPQGSPRHSLPADFRRAVPQAFDNPGQYR